MIRALGTAIKAIILSVFIASVLVTVAVLAALTVVTYGFKMALWPGKRGIGDILLERAMRQVK